MFTVKPAVHAIKPTALPFKESLEIRPENFKSKGEEKYQVDLINIASKSVFLKYT